VGDPAEETYCYPNIISLGHPPPPCQLGTRSGRAKGRLPAFSRGADTEARKPLKRLALGRSARNTPLKQGVNESWGSSTKLGCAPRET